MPEPPTGTVTFLFTDIEGSTRLLQALGDGYRSVQDRHGEILRTAIRAEDGHVVRTEGDSFFATFRSPIRAVEAAVGAQRMLATNDWRSGTGVRVRMGLHTGEGILGGDDYIGIDVNRAARISAAAHGGQVLLSEATHALVQHHLPDGVAVRDLGEHRLKDIAHTERLYDLVIDKLPSDFPPITSLNARLNNAPLHLTSFVGRTDQIEQAVRLLREHRLVTLTGPGGSGKSRLAIEVAREVLPHFDEGVFFVDLAPLSDHAQVPSEIVQALRMREQPGRVPIDTLVDGLAARHVLLVLDNYEHVLPAAWVAERLLAAAPRLRILATSRAPLRLYGEQEQPVPPMALPDFDSAPELDVLSRNEAIVLFVERARAARPGFTLTSRNAAAVAGICARLDGLPLAIELAASRIRVLTPQAMGSRLTVSSGDLVASARNLPSRQRTLRATIDWSHRLLNEPEQRLFTRLSVFRGGASLDAAEAVGNPDRDLGADSIEVLSTLVDNSLIRQTELPDGEPRFSMLETIREYAGDLLGGCDDAAPTRRRHAEFFLGLARDGESHLTAEDQVRWLNRFENEHDNFQAAFQWTLDTGQPDKGAEAAAAMWRFWQQRGYLFVGRTWLERLLSAIGEQQTPTVAKAHLAAGGIAYWQRDYEATDRHYRRALAIYELLDDLAGVAEATFNVAFIPGPEEALDERGEWRVSQGSVERLQEAMNRFEELGDRAGVARATGNMALFLGANGDLDAAFPMLEEAIASYRELGERLHLADALGALGQGHLLIGNHLAAREAMVESLDLLTAAKNWSATGLLLEMLSFVELAQGRAERAVRLYGAAEEIQRRVEGGYPHAATEMLGIDLLADARIAIGDEAVDRALADGRSMTRADAVAYATEPPRPS